MKVKEWIERLQKCNPEAELYVKEDRWPCLAKYLEDEETAKTMRKL